MRRMGKYTSPFNTTGSHRRRTQTSPNVTMVGVAPFTRIDRSSTQTMTSSVPTYLHGRRQQCTVAAP